MRIKKITGKDYTQEITLINSLFNKYYSDRNNNQHKEKINKQITKNQEQITEYMELCKTTITKHSNNNISMKKHWRSYKL